VIGHQCAAFASMMNSRQYLAQSAIPAFRPLPKNSQKAIFLPVGPLLSGDSLFVLVRDDNVY
jgi:hypothetical protein